MAGYTVTGFAGFPHTEVDAHGPALITKKPEKHQRAQQALAISLENAIAQKTFSETGSFIEKRSIARSGGDT